MRKVSLLASIMFCIGIMFSSCVKEENLAADIAGTYKGTNYFSKATETNALVVITEIDNNHVSVQYDAATKELAYAGSEAKVTKEGNVYKGRRQLKLDPLLFDKVANDYLKGKISLEQAISILKISRATFFRRLKARNN